MRGALGEPRAEFACQFRRSRGFLGVGADSDARRLICRGQGWSIIVSVQAQSLEILENAAVPPAQARAIVQAIEIEIEGARNILATKQDLLALRHELLEKLAEFRSELRVEMHVIASSLMRQMYGAMLGQLAVLLGIAYFFVSHLNH